MASAQPSLVGNEARETWGMGGDRATEETRSRSLPRTHRFRTRARLRCDDELVPTLRFGLIQRAIGTLQPAVGVLALVQLGQPDRGGHRERLVIARDGEATD